MNNKTFAIIVLAALALGALVHAGGVLSTAEIAPPLLAYRGMLVRDTVSPSAPVDMRVSLYDAGSGGNLVWGPEEHDAMNVTNGQFSIILGTTAPLTRAVMGFLRGVDHGQGRDPDGAARAAMNPGGNVGDQVGSLE